MEKSQRYLVILPLSVIIAVAVLAGFVRYRFGEAGLPVGTVRVLDPSVAADRDQVVSLIALSNRAEEVDQVINWGDRDPFRSQVPSESKAPAAGTQLPLPRLELTGIIWSAPRVSAIIDDTVVGVGGSVKGMTVREIVEDAVVLSNGQQDMTLRMKK